MNLVTKEAWLTALATVLGVSESACRNAKHDDPAAVRDVPPASAPAVVVAASAPEPVIASVAPSASAPPSASAVATPSPTTSEIASMIGAIGTGAPSPFGSIGVGNIGTIGRSPHANCGASCGARSQQQQPTAQVGLSYSNGGHPEDQRMLAVLRPRMRSCANKGLQTDPNEQGRVTLMITIAANGDVTNAVVVNNTGVGAGTAACMATGAKQATFVAMPTSRQLQLAIVQTKL